MSVKMFKRDNLGDTNTFYLTVPEAGSLYSQDFGEQSALRSIKIGLYHLNCLWSF